MYFCCCEINIWLQLSTASGHWGSDASWLWVNVVWWQTEKEAVLTVKVADPFFLRCTDRNYKGQLFQQRCVPGKTTFMSELKSHTRWIQAGPPDLWITFSQVVPSSRRKISRSYFLAKLSRLSPAAGTGSKNLEINAWHRVVAGCQGYWENMWPLLVCRTAGALQTTNCQHEYSRSTLNEDRIISFSLLKRNSGYDVLIYLNLCVVCELSCFIHDKLVMDTWKK